MGAEWKRKGNKTYRSNGNEKKNEKDILLGPNAVTTTKSRIKKEE